MVRTAPWLGLAALLSLLLGLVEGAGLGWFGFAGGALYGLMLAGLLNAGLTRARLSVFGPANLVTLFRAVLVGGVAALVVDTSLGGGQLPVLAGFSALALALDAVDGRVARRTGSVTSFGARFDLEVDAFLILLLSILVSRSIGWWVLAIGAARYALVLASRAWPWLRRPAPPRYWCKVVAALQGVALTLVLTGRLPALLSRPLLLICLALLAESFGREAWSKWQRRVVEPSIQVLRPRRSAHWSHIADRHRMPCTTADPRQLRPRGGN